LTGDGAPGAIVEVRSYDDTNGRKKLSLATRSGLAIEEPVAASGATSLDRQGRSRANRNRREDSAPMCGTRWMGRVDHLIEQGLATRQGLRIAFARIS
jgi:hypothetical protein